MRWLLPIFLLVGCTVRHEHVIEIEGVEPQTPEERAAADKAFDRASAAMTYADSVHGSLDVGAKRIAFFKAEAALFREYQRRGQDADAATWYADQILGKTADEIIEAASAFDRTISPPRQ
jgi:hypothetical protein